MSGKLSQGSAVLTKKLASHPDNDQIRFELGVLQFFQTVEHLGQSLYQFGPNSRFGMGMVPLLRLPVPENPKPNAVQLSDIRGMFQRAIDDLTAAEKTLAKISSDDVRLPLRVFQFHLDFDKDGQVGSDESLKNILQFYLPNLRNRPQDKLEEIEIVFDRSDVDWLRGYCCMLRAVGEIVLAYDQELLWNTAGARMFSRGIVEHDFLREEEVGDTWSSNGIMDLIAIVHNMRFKLKDRKRLVTAHGYLLETIGHSRNMWKRILAESDDDHEWIPSPKQKSALARVNPAMTESWSEFLDESEKLLNGQILVPFWRGTNKNRGINLHKVFHQPSDIDLVLWAHGTGMKPFIEIGECTKPETWREFQNVFGRNFFGFAVWFN